MLYAQASGKNSLREIETGLLSQPERLYHFGLKKSVSHSTLADANARRPWQVYEQT